MAWMQENDQASQQELKRLRKVSSNSTCADCGCQDNSWASVTHGVFVCMVCSDVHRSVGTHITKVKGCTGTYLWGPDELERMQTVTNAGANTKYGSKKIDPAASKEHKQRYVVDKYEKLFFVDQHCPAACLAHAKTSVDAVRAEQSKPVVRKAAVATSAEVATRPCVQKSTAAPIACAAEISDAWFDDFFNEQPSCEKAAIPAKSHEEAAFPEKANETSVSKSAQLPLNYNSNSLDAFLDAALHVKSTPTSSSSSISAYPASLDPFHKVQPAFVMDPLFDWPEL
jgi:hypothetical protein